MKKGIDVSFAQGQAMIRFIWRSGCRIAKDMGYKNVYTYTLVSENGASLKASNFVCEGQAGNTHWTGKRNKGQNIPNEMKNRWHKKLN